MNWDASGLTLGVRAGLPDSRRLSANQHPFSKPRTFMIQLLQTGMPPSNLSFLIAAFVVTGVISWPTFSSFSSVDRNLNGESIASCALLTKSGTQRTARLKAKITPIAADTAAQKSGFVAGFLSRPRDGRSETQIAHRSTRNLAKVPMRPAAVAQCTADSWGRSSPAGPVSSYPHDSAVDSQPARQGFAQNPGTC